MNIFIGDGRDDVVIDKKLAETSILSSPALLFIRIREQEDDRDVFADAVNNSDNRVSRVPDTTSQFFSGQQAVDVRLYVCMSASSSNMYAFTKANLTKVRTSEMGS